MKKRLISVILAAILAVTPTNAFGFSDGTGFSEEVSEREQVEAATDLGYEDTDDGMSYPAEEFSAPSDEAGFSDEFSEELPVADTPAEVQVANAQDMYKISVSGTVYLSQSQKFIDFLNADRENMGLKPVALDEELMQIATMRAIQGNVVYGHYLPDGKRALGVLFPQIYAGECAAKDYTYAAEKFFQGWKNSPSHWSILTDPDLTRAGVAIFNTGQGAYSAYYVARYNSYKEPTIPYTGDFEDYTVKNFEMDVLPEYLNVNYQFPGDIYYIYEGENLQIHPIYRAVYLKLGSLVGNVSDGFLDNSCGLWESSDTSVVTIDANGMLTGKKSGEATVRFYVNGDRDKCYEADISVSKRKPNTDKDDTNTDKDDTNIDKDDTNTDKDDTNTDKDDTNTDKDDTNTDKNDTGSGNDDTIKEVGTPIVKVEVSKNVAVFTWGQSKNAHGYQIEISRNGGKYDKRIWEGADSCTCILAVSDGENIKFRVKAYRIVNGKKYWSKYSNEVSTVKDDNSTNDGTGNNANDDVNSDSKKEIAAPKITVKTSGKTVTLSWDKPESAAGYQVYVSNGGSYKKQGIIDTTRFSKKYAFGSSLKLRVKAYRVVDGKKYWSGYSNTVKVTVKPSKPDIISISNKTSRTLTVSWKKVKDAEGYVVYRKTGKNGTYKKVKTIKSGKTVSYKNTKLKNGTTYYYKIRAYGKDSAGKTIYSAYSKAVGKKI